MMISINKTEYEEPQWYYSENAGNPIPSMKLSKHFKIKKLLRAHFPKIFFSAFLCIRSSLNASLSKKGEGRSYNQRSLDAIHMLR